MLGFQGSKAPIKSQERDIQKIMNHYGRDAFSKKKQKKNSKKKEKNRKK